MVKSPGKGILEKVYICLSQDLMINCIYDIYVLCIYREVHSVLYKILMKSVFF